MSGIQRASPGLVVRHADHLHNEEVNILCYTVNNYRYIINLIKTLEKLNICHKSSIGVKC